jgi:hypothetical protein
MKLPNNDKSTIPPEKITDYLLNELHPIGKDKAAFFASFCFKNEDSLRAALLNHAAEREIHEIEESPYGTKYKLRCEIKTPDLRNPCIVSVWIVNNGNTIPRLITAYPY